jgi:hypothetical protein
MDITPPPEFRLACRVVLGGDDPGTVLPPMMRGDPVMQRVYALQATFVQLKAAGIPLDPNIDPGRVCGRRC